VRGLRANPHEKRPVSREERRLGPSCTLCVDGSLLGKNVVEVVAIGVVAHDVTILVDVVTQEVARHGVPFIPARRHIVVVVSIEILPEEGRPVTLLLDPGGHRRAVAA
jgi:hypothetical protein